MNNLLIPEAILQAKDREIRQLAESLRGRYGVDIDNDIYGPAFRYYLAFSHQPSLLAVTPSDLDDKAVLYNRFYWFSKFVKLHTMKHGYDPGLEQQTFQLLEQASCQIDWSVIEDISRLVSSEAEGHTG